MFLVGRAPLRCASLCSLYHRISAPLFPGQCSFAAVEDCRRTSITIEPAWKADNVRRADSRDHLDAVAIAEALRRHVSSESALFRNEILSLGEAKAIESRISTLGG